MDIPRSSWIGGTAIPTMMLSRASRKKAAQTLTSRPHSRRPHDPVARSASLRSSTIGSTCTSCTSPGDAMS
ncbi:hypothetical protein ACFQ3Z_08620 [Streptomyces nogalater]